MCWNLAPAALWKSSPVRCATVPLPGDANVTWSGFALAAATTSASDLNGELAETTSTRGAEATSVTGARSLSGSYGSFGNSVGLMARLLVCPITTVYPSGGDFAACSTPRLPPTPGLFSTTTTHFKFSASFWLIVREKRSVPPPGGNGTMSLIGFAG